MIVLHRLPGVISVPTLLLFVSSFASPAFSQNDDFEVDAATSIVRSATFSLSGMLPSSFGTRTGRAAHVGRVDLGTLEVDQVYRIELHLENSTVSDLAFDQVKTSCACGSFKIEKAERIKAGDSQVYQVFYRAPKSTEDARHRFTFDFIEGQKHVGGLYFSASLSRNLFMAGSHMLEIGADRKKLRIPISFTDPIVHEDLQLEVSRELANFFPKLIKREGRSLIELDVSPQQLKEDFLFGSLEVFSETHEVSASSELMLQRREQVQVSPQLLNLRRKADDRTMFGNMIVRIVRGDETGEQESSNRFSGRPSFKIDSGAVKFAIKSTKLNDDVFRIVVTVDADQVDLLEDVQEIVFTTIFDGVATSKTISLILPN